VNLRIKLIQSLGAQKTENMLLWIIIFGNGELWKISFAFC